MATHNWPLSFEQAFERAWRWQERDPQDPITRESRHITELNNLLFVANWLEQMDRHVELYWGENICG